MKLAEKTLEQIRNSITIDNGKRFKELEKKWLLSLEDAYKSDPSPFRNHLGASLIGDECDRKIWLSFHHVQEPKFNDRMIRLFNRGHLEEGRFLAMLECANIEPCNADPSKDGKQYGGRQGWFGGSIDGLAKNVPDLPNENVMLEFKTMNDSRFSAMTKKGVYTTDRRYYLQMQANFSNMNTLYPSLNLKHCLFMCVNKNNDDIYIEIVDYDEEIGKSMIDKANNLATSSIPKVLKPCKAYMPCKMCEYRDICFENIEYPHKDCRNCANCLFTADGECTCLIGDKYSESCYVKNGDEE